MSTYAYSQRAALPHMRSSGDLLFHGQKDDDFARNTREIFQIYREKEVILSAKKLVIGVTKVPFVGHEVDSPGLNMS